MYFSSANAYDATSSAAARHDRHAPVSLCQIISGGQNGAERSALEAARALRIKTGGTAPPNYLTHSGPRPELEYKFHLNELATLKIADKYNLGVKPYYTIRARQNVRDGDATVVFRAQQYRDPQNVISYCFGGGMKKLREERWYKYETSPYRPVLIIDEIGAADIVVPPDAIECAWYAEKMRLRDFLIKHNVRTLNVTGYTDPEHNTVCSLNIRNFLVYALR